MIKAILISMLPFLVFFGNGTENTLPELTTAASPASSGTMKKMIVASGNISLDLDLNRLNGSSAGAKAPKTIRFDAEPDSFFTIIVFNGELRGPVPSSMKLIPKGNAVLPARLSESYQNLVVESLSWGGQYDLVVRDGNSGFTFFNIEGYSMEFEPNQDAFSIKAGRMLLSDEFAAALGRPGDTKTVVGEISLSTKMKPIEVTEILDGEVQSSVLPAGAGMGPEAGTVPGPDVIVGDVNGLAQFGSTGSVVGLALGTDSCNAGVVNLNWNALPSNDHPVIPQNMYRMSGGATNDERFEQIGQSSVKHGFTALTQNICGFGCNGVGGPQLGSGCSDPYSASLNAGPSLGSRAWVNPFTGFFPRGDSATPPNNHSGHGDTSGAAGHRVRVEQADLNTTLNVGATYYAEGQYVTPHEYAWCQANPTQCNMNNNVSYRRYNVTGTTSFSFSPVGSTVRQKAAIEAWTGATKVTIQPDVANDGIGTVAYKVTNPSAGVWHYEFAVYNQNMDRGIQSFSVPVGAGVTISNIGFHAPPQHPGTLNDNTVGNAGFSSTPWNATQANGTITWSTETFAQNQNANAIRWGTLYNFRFDANAPPADGTGTIGFYKTGSPINIEIQGPAGAGTPTPTNTPTATPTNTPTATPTATPTPGFEGDVSPRPNGNGVADSTDVIQLRRFATGLDTPGVGTNEAQRADAAPLATNGDGLINSGDVIQGRRFATGLDPLTPAGGPSTGPSFIPDSVSSFIDDVYAYFFGREMRIGSAISVGNGKLTVPVEMVPYGDEVGIGFTLEYDARLLANPRVELGDGAPSGSVLTINTNEMGRIGILIDSIETMTASAMPRRILMVTFDVSPGASGKTSVALTGSLAPRGAADAAGNMLSVRYVDGAVTIASEAKAR